ncbi:hypothetical protein [Lacibacter sp.]|uniref:hypothetical protein n=1 Tax=Lacibacter sp. TaxID=1915409 RepID=UPI002B4B311A|nr:hypothetical protein [Lacibacter sp.]HLP36756.1 hypothetical protein [Lacibacter sp.]
MAIWQFHIYFIPKKSLLNKYGQVPTQLSMDKESWNDYFQDSDLDQEPEFEDALTIRWWLDLNIKIDNFLPLLKTFGDIQSWTQNSDGLRSFGDTDTNDISVCFNDSTNIVEEVSCRLDLRQLDKNFIDKVLSLATQFDCLLMDRQGRLYQPSMIALFDTIKLSNANRFVGDPEKFLNDLSKGIVTPE